MKTIRFFAFSVLFIFSLAILSSGCHHHKHISKKSPGADPKYAPCHCNDWTSRNKEIQKFKN